MGSLEQYHRKRHFDRTPEPRGREHASTRGGGAFVIQKHDARRLHYDFRLELDGVLKSWAVPRGPSLDPAEKRLAVHTEDHPLEYGGFEGVIPEGEYGGGTVLLWDRGRWTPRGDPRADYRRGRLTFDLEGERLQGRWHLVRSTSSRRRSGPGKEEWLLIKGKDEHARPGHGSDLVDQATTSVESGLDLGRIAALRSRLWTSEEGEVAPPPRLDPADLQGARRARSARAGALEPALARLVERPPEGDAWLHELKLDGYRILAHLETTRGRPDPRLPRRASAGGDELGGGGAHEGRHRSLGSGAGRASMIRLLTRAGKDWTARFPEVAEALRALPAEEAVVDGEVAVLLPDGRTSFQALQNLLSSSPGRRGELVFFAFDLLRLDGWDLRASPLIERKRALAALLERVPRPLRFSAHIVGHGGAFYERACGLGAEGIVSKRADSPYRAGRGGEWLKIKCLGRQELVIGGFTEPAGSRTGLGALVVGYHDPDGRLRYAGRVGTGFTAEGLRALRARLAPLERDRSPFADRVPRPRTKLRWVEPRLVAEVSFTEWTDEGLLRHPSFQGLRDDKDPRDVVREGSPAAGPTTTSNTPPVTSDGRVRRRGSVVEVAGVTISSPEKVLYPEAQVTKEELATYYAAIADWVLPRLGRRPLTLVRCPGGCGKKCFYQKHGNKTIHPDVPRIPITEAQDEEPYVYVETLEQLTRLVQLNVLEFHVWGSSVGDIHRADTLVFDLDPDEGLPFSRVADAAKEVRDRLAELGLPSFCKTTGGKGLHVVVPIQATLGWDDVKQFTKAFSEEFARKHPERYTSKITKISRRGRVFIDYLRNQFDATAIGAYSARARPGATVSVPVRWDEVTGSLDPTTYTVRSVPHRLAQLAADPWAELDAARAAVTEAMKEAVGFAQTRLPRPRARGRGH